MKSRKNAGFTLAETLLAVLILLLVSAIVANGIPVARNAYEKVVIGANARVLLSTTVSALRSAFTTARDIQVSTDKKTVTYYSADTGTTSKIYLSAEAANEDEITLQTYTDVSPQDAIESSVKPLHSIAPRNLIPRNPRSTLCVTYDGIELSTNVITFKNLRVCLKSDTDKSLASIAELKIRLISPIPTPAPTLSA